MLRQIFCLLFLLITTAGCATVVSETHEFFKSCKIVDVKEGEAVLCMGSDAGARVGQEFAVYRFTEIEPPGRRQPPAFKRELVGAVKITEVAEFSAKARVLRGEIKVNDVARLGP